MNDDKNLKLANFIASFGSMNNFSSTVLQTKNALDTKSDLTSSFDNKLLLDAIDGIKAAKKYGFNSDGIIAINKAFIHNKKEDPHWPGHLRQSLYPTIDDVNVVLTDPNGSKKDAYYAPSDVYKSDLDEIVDNFNQSNHTNHDAWRVFADLAKLQPFQDGNKRTALIAANAAKNTWSSENYLVLPFNSIDHAEFMIDLMRYYVAETKTDEDKAFDKMMQLVPSKSELAIHLNELSEDQITSNHNNLKTKKSFYKSDDIDFDL